MQPSKHLLFVPGPGFGSHEEARVLGPRLEALGWAASFWNDPSHTEAGKNIACSFEQYLDSLEHHLRSVGRNDLTIACHSAAIHPMLIVLERTSITPNRILLIAPACDLTDAFCRVLGLAAADLEAGQPDATRRLKVLIGQIRQVADAAMREGLELAATDPILFTHYWHDQIAMAAFGDAAQFPDGQFRPDVFFIVLDGLGRCLPELVNIVDIPTIALFGIADPVINSEVSLSVARKIFSRLSVETLHDTGHWVHLEHPDAFVALLINKDGWSDQS